MEWIKYAIAILSGIATAIPLIIQLVKHVRAAAKEKNWDKLLDMTMGLMAEAEGKFDDGLERKEWVLMMIKARADSIDYDIDLTQIADMIDAICDLTKVVNPPENKIEYEAE